MVRLGFKYLSHSGKTIGGGEEERGPRVGKMCILYRSGFLVKIHLCVKSEELHCCCSPCIFKVIDFSVLDTDHNTTCEGKEIIVKIVIKLHSSLTCSEQKE